LVRVPREEVRAAALVAADELLLVEAGEGAVDAGRRETRLLAELLPREHARLRLERGADPLESLVARGRLARGRLVVDDHAGGGRRPVDLDRGLRRARPQARPEGVRGGGGDPLLLLRRRGLARG